MWEIWWTRTAGPEAVDAARRSRFNALVRFARNRSPFYRDAYRGLPERELDPRELPVVTKPRLMAHFDDWVTDPEIKLADLAAFVADREHIGERYLERYVVWKSSGSTGEPGVYVQDADALATFDALMAVHLDLMGFGSRYSWDLLAGGGAGGAGYCYWRSFRKYCLVAARLSKQPMDSGACLFHLGPAAPARCSVE